MHQRFSSLMLSGALGCAALGSAGQAGPQDTRQPAGKGSGTETVSIDVLRHPISTKVRRRLLSAIAKMDLGDHEAAIAQLRETLEKYPDSAAYVQNLLGVEYVKTDQYEAAVRSFEQAVSLLPRDAMTHYNFGLALICAGDDQRAQQELRRAVELDPTNSGMRQRLAELEQSSRN